MVDGEFSYLLDAECEGVYSHNIVGCAGKTMVVLWVCESGGEGAESTGAGARLTNTRQVRLVSCTTMW